MSRPDIEMQKNSALWQLAAAGLIGFVGLTLTTSLNEVVVIGGWIIVGINIFTAGFATARYCIYAWG